MRVLCLDDMEPRQVAFRQPDVIPFGIGIVIWRSGSGRHKILPN